MRVEQEMEVGEKTLGEPRVSFDKLEDASPDESNQVQIEEAPERPVSSSSGEDSAIDKAVNDLLDVQGTKQKLARQKPASRLRGYGAKSLKGAKPNHKHNQDAFVLRENLMYEDYLHFFAAIDGHGGTGHECANYVKNNFAALLREFALTKLKEMLEREGMHKPINPLLTRLEV